MVYLGKNLTSKKLVALKLPSSVYDEIRSEKDATSTFTTKISETDPRFLEEVSNF